MDRSDIQQQWVLEFLLRQPTIKDHVMNRLISAFPPPIQEYRLLKTLLLRRISSNLEKGRMSQKVLETLELIEELDYQMGIRTLDSMKEAYGAVLVLCAVRFLIKNPNCVSPHRIFEGRWFEMEIRKKADLVSCRSKDLRTRFEEALHTKKRVYLSAKNTSVDALESVRVFLEEAIEKMGPPFLELAAKKLSEKGNKEVQNFDVTSIDDRVEDRRDSSCHVVGNNSDENASSSEKNFNKVDANSFASVSNKRATHEYMEVNEKGKEVQQEKSPSFVDLESHTVNEKVDVEVLVDTSTADRVGVSWACPFQVVGDKLNENAGRFLETNLSKVDAKSAVSVGNSHVIHQFRDVNGKGKEVLLERGSSAVNMTADTVNGKIDGVHDSINIAIDDQSGESEECFFDAMDRSFDTNDDRISGDRLNKLDLDSSVESPCIPTKKCNQGPTSEFGEVQEALNSSNFDLNYVVKDSLPAALCMAANASASMVELERKSGLSTEQEDKVEIDNNNHSIIRGCEESHFRKRNTRIPAVVLRPSLLKRKNCSYTRELYGVRTVSSSEESPQRKNLHTPKSKTPQDTGNNTGRRRKRTWSPLEAQNLVAAVRVYGTGNWKGILENYRDVFEGRTTVDLKDKWRNMLK